MLVETWETLSKKDVLAQWPGGLLQGFFMEPSFFDNTPLINYLMHLYNTVGNGTTQRVIVTGTSNADTGIFENIFCDR